MVAGSANLDRLVNVLLLSLNVQKKQKKFQNGSPVKRPFVSAKQLAQGQFHFHGNGLGADVDERAGEVIRGLYHLGGNLHLAFV